MMRLRRKGTADASSAVGGRRKKSEIREPLAVKPQNVPPEIFSREPMTSDRKNSKHEGTGSAPTCDPDENESANCSDRTSRSKIREKLTAADCGSGVETSCGLPDEGGDDGQSGGDGRAEPGTADQSSASNPKPIVAPKSFYGQAKSPSIAGDMRQRLEELSFTRRASYVQTPSPDVAPAKKRKRNLRPKAFKAAPQKTGRKVTKDCCGFSATVGAKESLDFIISTGKEERPLESNKFFKHHVPGGKYRCTVQCGKFTFSSAPPQRAKKGLIDFDYKEDKISHVAEEGGKCYNFGLTSVEDLERSGIPKVSILKDNRFNLRKRKSAAEKNLKPPKRSRVSSWKYAEDDAPLRSFTAGRSPGSSSIGCPQGSPPADASSASLGGFGLATKEPVSTFVPIRHRYGSKRGKLAAAAYEESTILVRATPEPGRTIELSNKIETAGARKQQNGLLPPVDPPYVDLGARVTEADVNTVSTRRHRLAARARTAAAVSKESTIVVDDAREPEKAVEPSDRKVPTAGPSRAGVPETRASTVLRNRKGSELGNVPTSVNSENETRKGKADDHENGSSAPDGTSNDNRAGTSTGRASISDPVPEKRVARQTRSSRPTPSIVVEGPSPEQSPASIEMSRIDFSPVLCDSSRVSPSPSPPPQAPSPSPEAVPGPSRLRQPPKPYNPLDDCFGFARMQFANKSKPSFKHPFVEVPSPTKKPKELTPKILATQNNLLSVKDAFSRGRGSLTASTPSKRHGSFRLSGLRETSTRFTSTPWEPTAKAKRVSFYGDSSSSTPNADGFNGLRRLIDRLGSKQLQIDAGQKKFGAKECPKCGMIFSQGEAEDEREHRKFHKQMDSVLRIASFDAYRTVDVLSGVGRIFLISAQDWKRVRDKLSEVLDFANRSVGLDPDFVKLDFCKHRERKFAVFVHETGTILSVIGAEPWSSAYRTVPGQSFMLDTAKRYPVTHSVFFMWTVPEWRRKGITNLLLYRLRVILGARQGPVSWEQLAFADLTPDLHKFVIGLSGWDTVLVAAPPDALP